MKFDEKQCKKKKGLALKGFLFCKRLKKKKKMASSLYHLFIFFFSVIPESQEKSVLVRSPMCGVAGREMAGLRRQTERGVSKSV